MRKTGQGYWDWLQSQVRWPREIQDRFWSKVSIGGQDECWMWSAGRHKYGNFSIGPRKGARQYGAHVFSYMLAHNLMESPSDVSNVVAHLCNTPRCVNPSHLELQTQTKNLRYSERVGRTLGEPLRKLSPEDIPEIRHLRAEGNTFVSIAKMFGVHPTTIFDVIRGRTWGYVA